MAAPAVMTQGGGAQGGYGGLQGVLDFLSQSGGINANQYGRLGQGYTGNWQADGFGSQKAAQQAGGAGVGGAHGAFAGLSPWAVQYLMQNVMQKNPAAQVSMTDANGAPLTGDALWMANLQQGMNNLAPTTYGIHSGLTADALQQLFANGIGGHSAYAKGYDASGRVKAQGPPSTTTRGKTTTKASGQRSHSPGHVG